MDAHAFVLLVPGIYIHSYMNGADANRLWPINRLAFYDKHSRVGFNIHPAALKRANFFSGTSVLGLCLEAPSAATKSRSVRQGVRLNKHCSMGPTCPTGCSIYGNRIEGVRRHLWKNRATAEPGRGLRVGR